MGVQSPGTFLFMLVGQTLQPAVPSKAVLVYIKSIRTAEGAQV